MKMIQTAVGAIRFDDFQDTIHEPLNPLLRMLALCLRHNTRGVTRPVE